MTTNRTVVLKSHPGSSLEAENLGIIDAPMPEIGDGEVLTRNIYASLDPGVRMALGAATAYAAALDINMPLGTLVIGEVIESRNNSYPVGSLMHCAGAIQEYSAITSRHCRWTVDEALSPTLSHALSILGMTGLTAYFGLLDVGKPEEGNTVLVSTAAGAVGSLAGQIAKIKGCKVVGIAGGPEKAKRLTDDFGFDAGIDYRGKDTLQLAEAIRAAAPEGIDVFYDNVGGEQLDAALANMNWAGRIASCGMISEYDQAERHQFQNLFQIVGKVLTVKGFLSFTYWREFPAALVEISKWMETGQIKLYEDIEDGIDNAIPGFLKLFSGANKGKMLVKIADR